jgi:hypothetical protein
MYAHALMLRQCLSFDTTLMFSPSISILDWERAREVKWQPCTLNVVICG